MHNKFTLYFRKVPSGKRLYYYYAYDEEGRRLGPWATGQESKTAARNYCIGLVRLGKLLPDPKKMHTFEEFSKTFWDWENSAYLKERRKRRKLTQSYADKNMKVVEHTLIPYFGKMRLDRITGEEIDKWLDCMIAEKYENTTTNGYYGTLQTMLKWAVKRRIIDRDPFLDVGRLLKEKKTKKLSRRTNSKCCLWTTGKKFGITTFCGTRSTR
uniref:Phage integrase central domain-containing protein n=1 Tax=uncultured bacterium contig00004 TaxID=1181496 RepID=A0A806KFI5_9BACT|nr:hypothetical protein [uncultured bacterium contig00004]